VSRINWARVVLCGLLAGGVWTVLAASVVTLVGQDFVEAMTHGRAISGSAQVFLFLSDLAAGIWAMWLYASIRPRYGPGAKTAIVSACAWWIIATMQSGKWIVLLALDVGRAAPLTLNLIAMVAATTAGAWAYSE
jgi:hypothetical protein